MTETQRQVQVVDKRCIIIQLESNPCAPVSHVNMQTSAVVVVKWSSCLPFTPTIRVRIPLKPGYSCFSNVQTSAVPKVSIKLNCSFPLRRSSSCRCSATSPSTSCSSTATTTSGSGFQYVRHIQGHFNQRHLRISRSDPSILLTALVMLPTAVISTKL